MYLLLDGCGTVLNRVGRLYFSTGNNNVIATKRSLGDDRRTEELSELCRDYHVPVYLDTPNIQQLAPVARKKGILLKGRRQDVPWNNVKIIINGMDDVVDKKIVNDYQNQDKVFLLQGGADYNLVQNDFVSAPNAVGDLFTKRFVNAPARHSSCNGVYFATAIGQVQNVWRLEEIAEVRSRLLRRSRDSGETKALECEKVPTPSHHAIDGKRLVPQLNCKLFSEAQKMPWEHYHRAEISIIFKNEIRDADLERLKNCFRSYERCFYTEKPLGGSNVEEGLEGIKRLLRVSADLDIPDGDLLLPTYHVQKTGPKSIIVSGYNPQRSIIALSVLDWLWIVSNKFPAWKPAFDFTNETTLWYFFTLKDLKSHVEDRLNWYSDDLIHVSER